LPSLRRQANRLREDLGATGFDIDGAEVVARFGSAEAAASGAERLRQLLDLPSAAVTVPRDQVGAVIGRSGQNLNALRATSGILGCDLDNETGELVVIGPPTP
jgi:hypothetical protein